MAIIEWDDDAFMLGISGMDVTHIEFVDIVNGMEHLTDAEFIVHYDALLAHTRKHFEDEDTLMSEYGFPAISEHRGEHERVLGEMTRFRKSIDRGMISFARSYVNDTLAHWFPLHAATMDSALAAHVKMRKLAPGGIPVRIEAG